MAGSLDPSVRMNLHFEYPRADATTRRLTKCAWLSLLGPGRIAIQSVFPRPEYVGYVRSSSQSTSYRW